MKKILLIVLIITLPLIAFFQYKNYKRFNPPVDYEYTASDKVDPNYYDDGLVMEYYKLVVEAGAFARLQWRNEGVDVRFPDQDSPSATQAATYYNQMITRIKWIEDKLELSAQLKSEGYSNTDVQMIESGIPAGLVKWYKQRNQFANVALGDRGEPVWIIQSRLVDKGYSPEVDGVFGPDTQNALINFQQANDLFPSGQMSEQTFESLFAD